MRSRTVVCAAAAGLLACPGTAVATHIPCTWGAAVDADPTRPDPLRIRVGAPTWGCRGPAVELTAAGQSLRFGGPRPEEHASPPPAEPSSPEPAPLRLALSPRRARTGRPVVVHLRAIWIGQPEEPAAGQAIRFAGRRLRTDASGSVRVRIRPRRAGVLHAVAGEARASLRVSGRSRSRATRG